MISSAISICVVGARGCGKTSLCKRFVEGTFDEKEAPTTALDWSEKRIPERNLLVRVMDTGWEEENGCVLLDQFLREADAFIVCFSLSDEDSFQEVESHFEKILRVKDDPLPPCLLLGCKSDEMEGTAAEKHKQAFIEAERHNCVYFASSSKENSNVKTAFISLCEKKLNAAPVIRGTKMRQLCAMF